MVWGWGNLCQQLAGKSGRCVVLAKDRVAVRACGGSDEHEEAPRRGSASAVRMAPSAAQEGQMRGVYRGEKGDFFGHLASQLLWLLCRGKSKRDSYIVTFALVLSYPGLSTVAPDCPTTQL